jgi:O-antigen/teichoic acid export membrane protein
VKNYAYKLSGEIGVRILSTVFLLVLARNVGAADFGAYSTAFAFAAVFMIFIDLGTNPILTREIVHYPAKRPQIIAAGNFLKTMTALIMLLALWATTELSNFAPEKAQLIHWFGWVTIGTAFIEYLSAIFTGYEQMGVEAVLKVISKSIVIFAALAALMHTHAVLPTVKVMGIFSIVSTIIGAALIRYRIGAFGFRADWRYLQKLLRQSMPIFGSMAFLHLYDSQDILILNYFKIEDHNIGLFALAGKIIDVFKIFPVLLASTFFPSLARQAHVSRSAFFVRARELFAYAIFGLPLLTGAAYIFAPTIIQTLYGKTYLDAVPALRLLLFGFLMMAFNLILLQLLIALVKEKQLFLGSALVCSSNIAFSALLVPKYGILGTGYSLILSELIYLAVQVYMVKKAYDLFSVDHTENRKGVGRSTGDVFDYHSDV